MDNIKDKNEERILIPPQAELRRRAVKKGSGTNAFRKAIEAAEEAIEELSVEFDDWINNDINEMMLVCDQIKEEGWTDKNTDKLFTLTHDLKGQATTLGYPVITEICNTLSHLLEKMPETNRISLKVIETFAQSIRTIILQSDKDQQDQKAEAISVGLRQMALKILTHELNLQEDQNQDPQTENEQEMEVAVL